MVTALSLILCAATYPDLPVQRVVSVHDGDTVTVDLAGCPAVFCTSIGVRIVGIDTPEMTDKRPAILALARQARAFTLAWTQAHAGTLTLRNVARDKYFRVLAEIWSGDESLGAALLRAKLARPYTGQGPKPW